MTKPIDSSAKEDDKVIDSGAKEDDKTHRLKCKGR